FHVRHVDIERALSNEDEARDLNLARTQESGVIDARPERPGLVQSDRMGPRSKCADVPRYAPSPADIEDLEPRRPTTRQADRELEPPGGRVGRGAEKRKARGPMLRDGDPGRMPCRVAVGDTDTIGVVAIRAGARVGEGGHAVRIKCDGAEVRLARIAFPSL